MNESDTPISSDRFSDSEHNKSSTACKDASRRRFLTGTASSVALAGSGLLSSASFKASAEQPPIGPQTQTQRQLNVHYLHFLV